MKALTGTLQLAVKKQQERTIPSKIFYQGALRVMRPQYLDDSGQVTYCVLNPGGGYLDGDRYSMAIHVREQAQLYLTTQSATKIYQTPKDKVYQKNKYVLEAGSDLVTIPDPIIPYENSRYFQEQLVYLDKKATYFSSEILTPGWDSLGRGFTYQEVNLMTKLYVDGRLKVADRVCLQPFKQHIQEIGMLEGYHKLASLLVVQQDITPEFLTCLSQKISQRFPKLHVGMSLLPIPGFALRVLGNQTQELEELIYYCYQLYCEAFFAGRMIQRRKY